jgi:hypothetical protein
MNKIKKIGKKLWCVTFENGANVVFHDRWCAYFALNNCRFLTNKKPKQKVRKHGAKSNY